jgi:outer membrane protein assembly factor BamB
MSVQKGFSVQSADRMLLEGRVRMKETVFRIMLIVVLASMVRASTLGIANADSGTALSFVQQAQAGLISGVPYHWQVLWYYCGPACLEMVFHFYGPDISQSEIADAARTDIAYVGTYTDDMRRATQFSNLSTSVGNEMPESITGYTGRELGYAAFEYGFSGINGLKPLIDSGYPIIVLTAGDSSKTWGHFRVVIGYDDASSRITMQDPLYGSNYPLSYATFDDWWQSWGGRWGLFAHPWDVETTSPTTVEEGNIFTVSSTVTYPCPSPFPTSAFPASSSQATIELPAELSLASGEASTKTLGNGTMTGGSSAIAQWNVKANRPGNFSITIEAEGRVSGSVSTHSPNPGYSYTDRIGGTDSIVTVCEPASTHDWQMFHHNLRHTGHSYSKAPSTNNLLWNYSAQDEIACSPAVADGMVFFGAADCRVYALNETTGSQIWNYTTGDYVVSSPAVVDGRVYVGSEDRNVYCLDALTGVRIWNYTTGGMVDSSPAVVDGMVFVGSADYRIYALNETTGSQIWNYTTGGEVTSSPAVVDGMVFVGSLDSGVYALNETAGSQIWNYTLGSFAYLSSPAVTDGMVFIGSDDNNVYALNETTGSKIWNYTTGGAVSMSSPAVADGKVFVGSEDNGVYALNETTGSKIWNYTTGSWVISSPAVADGKVFVGSWDGGVYALNETTGSQIWNYTTGNVVFSSPAVADGVVFVGSYDGHVYAFGSAHDVAIVNVTTSKSGCLPIPVVGESLTARVNVTVENLGFYTETFNVTVYANSTVIGTSSNITLSSGNITTVSLTWNTSGFARGNYTISANTTIVDWESDTADNSFVDGTILVTFIGDVNGDGMVRVADILLVAMRFGTDYGGPPNSQGWSYNSNCDINDDLKIRVYDVLITAQHFGQGP